MAAKEQRERPSVVKVTVNLPWRVWDAVKAIADEEHISLTETLRRAISTEVFRRRIEAEGGQLVVERRDGSRERVHFPY